MATSPKDTSLSSAFKHSFDQPLENMATTFQALGMEGWEDFLRDLVETPENYEAAAGKFINAQSEDWWDHNWEYFPRALFEQAGQIAGSMATRVGGGALGSLAGPWGTAAGLLLGPALFEAVQLAGPIAYERARNNKREEPTWDDWKGALSASAFSGALNALGIRNVGVLNNIGKAGQTAKRTAKAIASEGGTEWLQGYTEQVGGTLGTEPYKDLVRGVKGADMTQEQRDSFTGLLSPYYPDKTYVDASRLGQYIQGLDHKAARGEGLLGAGAGGVTQAGTDIGKAAVQAGAEKLGVTAARSKKSAEKTLTEKKKAREEGVFPDVQDSIRKAEAEKKVLLKEKLPNLAETMSPLEVDTFTRKILLDQDDMVQEYLGDDGAMQKVDKELGAVKETIAGLGLNKKDQKSVFKDVLDELQRAPDEYTINLADIDHDYGPGEMDSLDFFDMSAVEDFAKNRASTYQTDFTATLDEGRFEGTNVPYGGDALWKTAPELFPLTAGGSTLGYNVFPLGSVHQVYTDPQIGFMRDAPKGPLDPTFMSYSPLIQHLEGRWENKEDKVDFPKKLINNEPIPAAEMMRWLYIKTPGSTAGRLHGDFQATKTEKSKSKIARQAIESGVAEFLQDRINAGEKVTKQEVLDVYTKHRSNFKSVLLSSSAREVRPDDDVRQPLTLKGVGENVAEVMALPRSFGPLVGSREWAANEAKLPGESAYSLEEGDMAIFEDASNTYLGRVYQKIKKEEIEKSEILPDDYQDIGDPRTNERLADEWVDVVEPRIKKKMKGYLDLAPVINILTPPKVDASQRAIEPYAPKHGTSYQFDQHTGEGTDNLRRLGEDLEMPLIYTPEITNRTKEQFALDDANRDQDMPFLAKLRSWVESRANRKKTDPAVYDDGDRTHAWTDPSTLAWWRGGMFAHIDEKYQNAKGALLAEIQSRLHGYAQDPDQSEIYRSHVKNKDAMSEKEKDQYREGTKITSAWDAVLSNPELQYGSLTGGAKELGKTILLPFLPKEAMGTRSDDSVFPGVRFQEDMARTETPVFPGDIAEAFRSYLKNYVDKEKIKAFDKRADEFSENEIGPAAFDVAVAAFQQTQPFASIGLNLTEAQTKEYLKDIKHGKDSTFWLGPSRWRKNLVRMGLLDEEFVEDPEVVATVDDALSLAKNTLINVAASKRDAFIAQNQEIYRDALLAVPGLTDIALPFIENTAPSHKEYKDVKKTFDGSQVRDADIRPDYPLKADWPKALLQASIVKTLQHDPDITHIYIPDAGYGNAPRTPYFQALEEAQKIADKFDLDFKVVDEFTANIYNPKTGRREQGPVKTRALEIAPLRERWVLYGGPEGYQKGGLVKKATNQVLNYGDYGRRYI